MEAILAVGHTAGMLKHFVPTFLIFSAICGPLLAQDMPENFRPETISVPSKGLDVNSPNVKFKGNVDVLEMGREFDDINVKAAQSITVITPHIDAIYASWLSFDLEVAIIFAIGNAKNRFNTDEGAGTNTIILDEAAMTLKPFKQLEIRLGVIDSTINPILSIMSHNSFAGVSEKLTLATTSQDYKVYVASEQAIPSAGTVTPGISPGGADAYFMTATLGAEAKVSALNTEFKVASTYFEFDNLSTNVAKDSYYNGNSPESFQFQGDATQFEIGFQGYETGLSVKTDWTKTLSTTLIGSTIINQLASSDRNNGAQAIFNIKKKFKSFNIVPSFGMFNMAADVTPAAYTFFSNRYQNRKGYTAGLETQLYNEKIIFFASYTRANVLQEETYIADRNVFNLGMEAKYDFL